MQKQKHVCMLSDASGRIEKDYTVVHYDVVDGCLLCAFIMLLYQPGAMCGMEKCCTKENIDTWREV